MTFAEGGCAVWLCCVSFYKFSLRRNLNKTDGFTLPRNLGKIKHMVELSIKLIVNSNAVSVDKRKHNEFSF